MSGEEKSAKSQSSEHFTQKSTITFGVCPKPVNDVFRAFKANEIEFFTNLLHLYIQALRLPIIKVGIKRGINISDQVIGIIFTAEVLSNGFNSQAFDSFLAKIAENPAMEKLVFLGEPRGVAEVPFDKEIRLSNIHQPQKHSMDWVGSVSSGMGIDSSVKTEDVFHFECLQRENSVKNNAVKFTCDVFNNVTEKNFQYAAPEIKNYQPKTMCKKTMKAQSTLFSQNAMAAGLAKLREKYQGRDEKLPSSETTLRRAAFKGNADDIRTLVEMHKVNPAAEDSQQRTALYWAEKEGHNDIVSLLKGWLDLSPAT